MDDNQKIIQKARSYLIRRDIREAVSEVLAPQIAKIPKGTKKVQVTYKQSAEAVLEKVRNQGRNSKSCKLDLPKVTTRNVKIDWRRFSDVAEETLKGLRHALGGNNHDK